LSGTQERVIRMLLHTIDEVSYVLVLAVMLALVSASGGFCAGQAVGIKHPVLEYNINPDNAAGYEAAVARVMAMSEEEMLSYVPEKPFVRFCYCPNCHGGSQGAGIYSWSIDRPEELKCKYCGMVFPNEKYPCDQVMEGQNALGETVTYRYHQDKTRGDLQIFIPGHILMFKRGWIMGQCRALGKAYQATGKEQYARKAILILDRIAQVYPHYPMMRQWITTFAFPDSQDPPYSGAGGRWGRWAWSEVPRGVGECYDLVYDSEEFDKLSEIRGYDVREKLENDFFKATYEYINTFKRHDNNISPFYLTAAARIGRVINEPSWVHWAYKWLLEILTGKCYYDGMWHEAPSYHYQVMGGLTTAFNDMRGYTDPPGYVDETDGMRFDNLDPDKDIAFFAKAKNAPAVVGFPNGRVSPIHDTWANTTRAKPRVETVSTICPGYGHASLGRGFGPDQMQAQLHFSGAHGHSHYDNLNLTLFAKEREMLCDIGYSHTKLRHWSVCTIGHNVVAVDRQNQVGGDCDLLAFFPDSNGVSMVEADGKSGYRKIEGLDIYRRMLVMVPISTGDAYVVDIFRVRGGSTHDWLLHGSANHDMTAECNVELTPGRENMLEEGEEWVEPKTEGSRFPSYGAIRDVAEGKTDGAVVTTFTYVDEPSKGVRVHILQNGETEVYLGRSPSIRQAGKDSTKAWDYWMPQLIARRTGEAPLANTFVAVEEPFSGKTFIDKVERVQLVPEAEGAVALRVTHGDSVDTIISTLDEPPYPERVTADGISIGGKLGIVRQHNGETVGAWLLDGAALAGHGWLLKTDEGPYTGDLISATRKADGAETDSFVTAARLPAGNALHGVWMIVTHGNGYKHGYEIDRVQDQDGKSVIVLTDDHGLRIEDGVTREVFYPRGEIEGINSFYIPLAVTMIKAES